MTDKDSNITMRLDLEEGKRQIAERELRAELRAHTDDRYKALQVVFYATRDKAVMGIGALLLTLLGASWATYEVFDEWRDRVIVLEHIHTHDGEHD